METAIQIIVAGALLLAWIWVLGRPLVASHDRSPFEGSQPSYRSEVLPSADLSPDGSGLLDLETSWGRRLIDGWKAWLQRPAEVWRRQLFLASVFAALASSLLAIALRTSFQSRFIQLFGLMMIGLVIHLLVAVVVGRRLLEVNRSAVVAAERRKVLPSSSGIDIRASRAGDRRPVLEGTTPPMPPGPDPGDSGVGAAESAFDLAAELASELGAVEGAAPVDEAAMVSGLIESEWGPEPLPTPPGPADSPAADVSGSGTPSPDPAVDVSGSAGSTPDPDSTVDVSGPAPEATERAGSGAHGADAGSGHSAAVPGVDAEGTESTEAGETESEALFRRAAKDEPARSRRGKPIHIESQLDSDGDFSEAKAVNHP